MNRIKYCLAYIVLIVFACFAQATEIPDNFQQLPGREGMEHYKMKSNDMEVFMVPNNAAPVFTFMVLLKVGSANETTGNTGSAHLLEHMLFNKSTENFGKGQPKTIQQALYEAGSSFDKSNATTWTDRTNYYDTLPSDQLELSIRIEADRMRHGRILPEEHQTEMTVVRNEYERGENDPRNALMTAINSTAIWAHPYHHDTIGWRSDIENVTTEKLREHYNTYYWPNNAAAILVGDYDKAQAFRLIDQYFGSMPKSPKPIPQITTKEPPQEGERRVIVRRSGNVGWVGVAYKRPGSKDPDFPALEVIAVLMGNGITSRLYQALVETKLAATADSANWTFRDPYLIYFLANLAQGSSHQNVEQAIIAEVDKLISQPVSPDELKIAKRKIEVAVASSRDGTYPYASQLGESIASADWEFFYDYQKLIEAVTAEQIQAVAAKYFAEDNRTVGWFVPKQQQEKAKQSAELTSEVSGKRGYGMPADSGAPQSMSAAESASSTKPQNAAMSFATRVKQIALPSGAKVDVLENRMSPTVAIRGYIHAGEFLDPDDKPGLSSITAQMLDKGTKRQSKIELARRLESTGATLRFVQSPLDIAIQGYSLAKDVPQILDMLAEMLQSPAFPEEELVKLKSQMKTELLEQQENTFNQAISELNRQIFPVTHPYYSIPTAQKIVALEKITIQDVVDFWKKNYGGSGFVLAIAGDVKSEDIGKLVEKHFGNWTGGHPLTDLRAESAQPKEPSQKIITIKDKANVDIFLGNASGLSLQNPDYYAAVLATSVLGGSGMASRLSRQLRDAEGLTYGVSSRLWGNPVIDVPWGIYIGVAPANVDKALASIGKVVKDFRDRGIDDSELQIEKKAFVGRFKVAMSDNTGIAEQLATAETRGLGVDYLDKYPSLISGVTLDQANAAIQKYIPAQDKMIVTIAGDVPSK